MADRDPRRPVFFLGAGASAAFGLPTVTQFFSHLSQHDLWKHEGNDIGLRECVDHVARRLSIHKGHANYSFETFDAELVFGALESLIDGWALLTEDLGVEPRIGEILAPTQIIEHLKRRIVQVYSIDVDKDAREVVDSYGAVLDSLAEVGCLRAPLDVFTTNYDGIAEQVFKILAGTRFHDDEDLGGRVADGFLDTPGARPWFPNVVYPNSAIRIHKLHGSISWKWKDERSTRTPIDTGFPDPNPDSDCLVYFGYKSVPEVDPFRYLHNRLAATLREPVVVVIIGFRMADPYIRLLFETALMFNEELRLAFLIPDDPVPHGVATLLEAFPTKTSVAKCAFGAAEVHDELQKCLSNVL